MVRRGTAMQGMQGCAAVGDLLAKLFFDYIETVRENVRPRKRNTQMTQQPTRTSLRSRVGHFATFVGGIIDCAAASEAGRFPSRDALRRAGINPDAFEANYR